MRRVALTTCLLLAPASSALAAGGEALGWVRPELDELRPAYAVAWVVRLEEPATLDIHPSQWTQPYVSLDGSLIFYGTEEGNLVALHADDGHQLWKRRDVGKIGRAFGQVEDILFAGIDGALAGLEAHTGKERWRLDLGGVVGGAIVTTGTVAIVPVRPNGYTAVDAAGTVRWRLKRPKPEGISVRGQAPAQIDAKNGRVFLGSSDGVISAASLANGEVLWSTKLSAAAEDEPFPDVDTQALILGGGGPILAASYNGGLACIDASTGKVLWRNESLIHVTGLTHVPGAQWVVASIADGQVAGVDPKSGRTRWRYRLANGVPTTPVALEGGLVAVGASKGALAILETLSGRPLQVVTPGSGVSTSPFSRGRVLGVWTNKGHAIGLRFGKPLAH